MGGRSAGTFLLNSERDRVSERLAERTVSLWTALDQPDAVAALTNPYYAPVAGVLPIASDVRAATVNVGMFAPWLVPTPLQSELRHGATDPALAELSSEWQRCVPCVRAPPTPSVSVWAPV
jgi:hypothetical protein